MAKKTIEEIIAAEVKKATDRRSEWEVDDESVESILEGEGETRRGLLDILEKANKKSKSEGRDSLIANIQRNIDAEGVHLKKLEAALKDNETFQRRLGKNVAKSRTLAATAAAAPDALSQGTAKLSSKAHTITVGSRELDSIIRGYAQRMSDVVTGMRALGLPAKQFAAKTLVILNKIKKEINVDPGLKAEDRLTKRAKKICLTFVKQHTSNITKAAALGPLASLKKSLVKSAKQGLADRIKRLPGMGVMDRLAERMKITPLSEKLTPKGWDQEREAERRAGSREVRATDAEAAEERLEARSWGSANADTAERMRAQRGGSADLVDVLQRLVDRLDESDTDPDKGRVGDDTSESPRKVKESKKEKNERRAGERKKGVILKGPGKGTLAVLGNSPAPVGDSTGDSTGDSGAALETDGDSDPPAEWLKLIATNTAGAASTLAGLWQLATQQLAQDKEIHESEKAERAEDRQDAAERRVAGEGTTPIPALDELSNSPIPAGAGAGAGAGGRGGKGRGRGGGIGGIIGNFIGGVGGGVIAGFMKAVGGAAASSVQFIIAMTAFGVGLGAFFVALAGAAKIIQLFGGGEAIESLLTNAAAGLTAFNTIDGLNLLAVGAGMITLGAGLIAITGGSIISGLFGLLTIGDPLGDTARSLQTYNDIDGDNLLAVGRGMTALSRGIKTLTNDGMIRGFKSFMSSAAGAIAGAFGWLFGSDEEAEAEKKLGILGFVQQFEAIDADKLNESSAAIMKLAVALTALSDARRRENLGTGATSPTPTPTPTPVEGSDASTPTPTSPSAPPSAPPEFDATPYAAGPLPAPGSDAYADLRIKGSSGRTQMGGSGQATGGGTSHKGVTDFASMIQGRVTGFQRFTAFNDNYHQASKTSKHAQGLAVDFTVAGGKPAGARAASTVRRLADEVGVPRGDMLVLDEYNYPSTGSTGPHVHVGFNTEAAAMTVAELDTSPTGVPHAPPSRVLAASHGRSFGATGPGIAADSGDGGASVDSTVLRAGREPSFIDKIDAAVRRTAAGETVPDDPEVVALRERVNLRLGIPPTPPPRIYGPDDPKPEWMRPPTGTPGASDRPGWLPISTAEASRNGAGVGAATARHASQTEATPMIVANIGGPPPATTAVVPTMYPIAIPVIAQNPDQVLRTLHSVNYPV